MITAPSESECRLYPHLETVCECLVLELVRQTLAQGLACPGVVREAKITADLETGNSVRRNVQRDLLALTTCFRSLWLGSLLSWITIFPRIIAT